LLTGTARYAERTGSSPLSIVWRLDADIPEIIRTAPPYPSSLVSGKVSGRALHFVVAYNNADPEAIVITAYEPDPEIWSDSFSGRKP